LFFSSSYLARSLTDLGFELLDLKKRLDDYISSYKKLYEIENNLNTISKSNDNLYIKNKLRQAGWNNEEIFWSTHTHVGIGIMTQVADSDIFDGLIYRYLLIKSKFELGYISKLIIHSLFIAVANFKIENIINIVKESNKKRIEHYTDILDIQLNNILLFKYAFPKVLYEEIKNHILIRLYFLKPPKSILHEKLEIDKKGSESNIKYIHEHTENEFQLYPNHFKCLDDAFKEYLEI
jgi:hypothetical protein